jgi:xanthine dehydrogenase accessory factor
MVSIIMIRGGGDLASGIAIRLLRAGLKVAVTEIAQPLAVRRTVAFAEAVYENQVTIENITGRCVLDPGDAFRILNIISKNQVPVLVDPACTSAMSLQPSVIIDSRMIKQEPEQIGYSPSLYIGLGPGFIAGQNCQAVIETRRGHTLGRVNWKGATEPDTGHPEGDPRRVLRSPAGGILLAHTTIGQILEQGEQIAEVAGKPILAPFHGVLRGLLHPGLHVAEGWKIGDLDNRADPALCSMVSDKSLAVGGGVLEAILSKSELRKLLWD